MISRNALIFHSGGLGDFVLTWPLGLALGRLHPQSRIIYVTQASKGELAAAALGLEWRDAESGWPAIYSDPSGLGDKAQRMIAEAHSVYSFLAEPGDQFCKNVAGISPKAVMMPLRLSPPAGYSGHVSDYLLDQLSAHRAVRGAVEQILSSIRNSGLGGAAARTEPIVIHPGSGGRDKCWPVDGFLKLIEKISRPVRVLLGEVEMERFSQADIQRLEGAAPAVKPATYSDLYSVLSVSAGFIGHDSGPAHLAGMLGLPTLVLFGPSDPAVWRPIGPHVNVHRHLPLADLSADDVMPLVKSLF